MWSAFGFDLMKNKGYVLQTYTDGAFPVSCLWMLLSEKHATLVWR